MGQPAAKFPWVPSLLLALPAFGLAVFAGVMGIMEPVGLGLMGGAVGYLLLHLLAIHPRLEGKAEIQTGAEAVLLKSLDMTSIEEVGREFSRTAKRVLGPTRAYLMAANPDGGARVVSEDRATVREFGDMTTSALWLMENAEVMTRADIKAKEGDGAQQTETLMRMFNVDILMPLVHRGLLLGIAMLGREEGGDLDSPAAQTFFRTIRAFTTIALANVFLGEEAASKGTLRGKFDLATAMQESLMPESKPVRRKGFELRGFYRPVAECGGDLWAWRELKDDKVLVVIADATGHGAAPALLAAAAKGAIDAKWQVSIDNLDPGDLLSVLNRAVYRVGRTQYMMTAFAAVVDGKNEMLYYANGGQNFPLFMSGEKVEPLVARGNQLGAAEEATFETHSRPMKRGERVLLYTDGITEAGTPYMEPYGERRFRRAIMALAKEPTLRIPEILIGKLDDYLGDVQVSDDVTLCVVQCGQSREDEAAVG